MARHSNLRSEIVEPGRRSWLELKFTLKIVEPGRTAKLDTQIYVSNGWARS